MDETAGTPSGAAGSSYFQKIQPAAEKTPLHTDVPVFPEAGAAPPPSRTLKKTYRHGLFHAIRPNIVSDASRHETGTFFRGRPEQDAPPTSETTETDAKRLGKIREPNTTSPPTVRSAAFAASRHETSPPRKRVETTDPRPTPQAAETVCGELRRCDMLPVPDSAHPPGIPVLRPRPESGRQKPSAEKSLSACGSENRSGRATRTTRSAARNGRLPASHPAAAAIPQEKASRKNGTGNAPASECHEPEPPCPGRSPGAACGLGIPAESAAAERYRFGV